MSRNEIRLRLLELERRINHLQLLQKMQHDTIEIQNRTIDQMNGIIEDFMTGRKSWARTPSLPGR